MIRRCLGGLALAALVSCADETVVAPLAERGAALARDPNVSGSQYNRFACTTCHVDRPTEAGERIMPGAPLRGAARRPSYWNGETTHLREAVARCWVHFMRGRAEDLEGPTGDALGAWLESLSPNGATEGTAAIAHSWPRSTRDLGAGGDPARGRVLYQRACANCHGAFGSGQGRLGPLVSIVPQDTLAEHCQGELPAGVPDYASYARQVAYQKTRHGSFLGYAGSMPPFATELLSDEEMAHIVALFRCP